MTTNRMGLEQTLSDERLEDLAKGQYFFARGAYEEAQVMARELLAYRKASKEPVAWTTGTYSQNIGCNFGEKQPGEAPCLAAVYWDYKTFRHHTDCDEISDKWLQEAIENTGAKPLYIAPPLQAVTVPDGFVLVPRTLTAENGAKSALLGEFTEITNINCSECFGDDDCETCDGTGTIRVESPVSWTTIKAIWARGVEHFDITKPD